MIPLYKSIERSEDRAASRLSLDAGPQGPLSIAVTRRINDNDTTEISSWYTARGLSSPPKAALPSIGFIVPGVAAGYLYRTDSSLALIEGYVTNPRASSEDRNRGLEALTEHLLESARLDGFTHILVLTEDVSIQTRAITWNFNKKGIKTLMVKELD